jgi:hypothetical protein
MWRGPPNQTLCAPKDHPLHGAGASVPFPIHVIETGIGKVPVRGRISNEESTRPAPIWAQTASFASANTRLSKRGRYRKSPVCAPGEDKIESARRAGAGGKSVCRVLFAGAGSFDETIIRDRCLRSCLARHLRSALPNGF